SALLHEIGDLAAAGRISRTLTLRIRTAVDALESLGGNPVVLRSGQPAFADVDDSFTRGRHPRSLVGWNAAGEVLLVTVDGGRPDASGMTLAEAAGLLSGLGATEGFGFDHRSATFVAGGEVRNLPIDDVEPGAPAPTGGREIVPGHVERPAVNTFMVVPKLPDPPPAPPAGPSTKPGSGSPGKPGTGGTTAGTAPAKVTGAGGGSTAPGVAAPVVSGGSVLPGAVSDILHNPATKRAKRPTAKSGRTRRDRGGDGEDGEEVYAGDPSIPGWDDITAALTPEAVAEGGPDDELSLGAGEPGRDGPGAEVLPALLRLVAAGMITTVLWGLHRARQALRARPALWF
ncbi:MAG TPA: phosphodiester glycosidase family protein, partial [Acidimicrobiia bacterium]|nr:phosphodiester glycosidase family protein [Acidimicrobiia bacterium]